LGTLLIGAFAQGAGGTAGSVVVTAVVVVATVVVVVDVVVDVVDWAKPPHPAAMAATEARAMSLRMGYPFHGQDRVNQPRR
jgi:hypothetical protein